MKEGSRSGEGGTATWCSLGFTDEEGAGQEVFVGRQRGLCVHRRELNTNSMRSQCYWTVSVA